MRRTIVLMLSTCSLMAMATVIGCSDEEGGGDSRTLSTVPVLEVSDSNGASVSDGGVVKLDGFSPMSIYVANTGNADLRIKEISVVSVPAGAYSVVAATMPTDDNPAVVATDESPFSFRIELGSDFDPNDQPKATVTIRTNVFVGADLKADTEFVFHTDIAEAKAQLLIQPGVVDFQTVSADQSSTRTIALLNTGVADLEITRFFLSGHPGFEVKIDGSAWRTSAETASQGITLDTPLRIAVGESAHMDVVYYANDPEGASGQLMLEHNGIAGSTEVQLLANVDGPCISVNPARVDFGGKGVGVAATINMEIQSCGDLALEINAIDLVDDGGMVFSADPTSLGLFPLTVQPGQSVYLPVTYIASEIAPVNGGQVQTDQGMLQIRSNAFLSEYDVELSGYGTDGTCPEPVITVTEGDEVIPQTVLHVSGLSSTASNGQVTGYEWEVIQPPGSASAFIPSRFVANPSFEANVIGQYIFKLKVWDAQGNESCDSASHTVLVTSSEAIHVELLWNTPGDIDQTDEGVTFNGDSVGSDVDLHFLHPNAGPGGWFDSWWDCYWMSPLPDWAGNAADDNPRLDRDDVDGAGPENLNLSVPEFGKVYTVGAHYWNDWGYGTSYATIRVYIYGSLSFTWDDVLLVNRDMWEVATIQWPSGVVTPIQAGPNLPRIIPNIDTSGVGGLPF